MEVLETSTTVDPHLQRSPSGASEIAQKVMSETLAALTIAGVLQESERDGFEHYLIANSVKVGDIFPVMAELRGIEEGDQPDAVGQWARLLAPIVKKRYALLPFADRLLSSTSMFDKHEPLFEMAVALKCPIIFAEDTDVLGFGTLNPISGLHLIEFAEEYLKNETGSTPYFSMFLLDLPTWETICRRQLNQ